MSSSQKQASTLSRREEFAIPQGHQLYIKVDMFTLKLVLCSSLSWCWVFM